MGNIGKKWKQLAAAVLLAAMVAGCGSTAQAPSSGETPPASSDAA